VAGLSRARRRGGRAGSGTRDASDRFPRRSPEKSRTPVTSCRSRRTARWRQGQV